MNFDETLEFSKDFKRLSKKYRSLSGDLLEFKKVILKSPLGTGRSFAVLMSEEDIKIIKARLFCRYLKGSSLRNIYAYCESRKRIEFIQVYFKDDSGREDRERIRSYLDDLKYGMNHR